MDLGHSNGYTLTMTSISVLTSSGLAVIVSSNNVHLVFLFVAETMWVLYWFGPIRNICPVYGLF